MPRLIATPFKFVGQTKLGSIYRPYVVISVHSRATNAWLPIEFVVDTGADFTLLPKKYASLLGINLSDFETDKSSGIGGNEKVYLCPSLPIKINNWQKNIPAGFLSHDQIPPLLGRLKCLEVIKAVFQNRQTIFETI